MSDLWQENTEYKIGMSQSSLVALRLIGVPPPDQIVFNASSVNYVRADGSRVGDGYASIQWVWDVISNSSLSVLLGFLEGAESTAVFVQSPERDGTFPNDRSAMGVFSGIMLKPILSGSEGVPIARSQASYQTVQVTFRNVVSV